MPCITVLNGGKLNLRLSVACRTLRRIWNGW